MCRFRGRRSSVDLELQNTWQAQRFVDLEVQISWQAQCSVSVEAAEFAAGAALCEPRVLEV